MKKQFSPKLTLIFKKLDANTMVVVENFFAHYDVDNNTVEVVCQGQDITFKGDEENLAWLQWNAHVGRLYSSDKFLIVDSHGHADHVGKRMVKGDNGKWDWES